MKEEDIPSGFVNRKVILELVNEANYYRSARTAYMLLALIGWGAFVFLLFKGGIQ